jgi:hypothetical protein
LIFDAAAACLMSLLPLRRHYAVADDIFHADDALPPHDAIAAISADCRYCFIISLLFADDTLFSPPLLMLADDYFR